MEHTRLEIEEFNKCSRLELKESRRKHGDIWGFLSGGNDSI
jgi:hypothetical protein